MIVETITKTGGPPGLEPRRRRADARAPPGLRQPPKDRIVWDTSNQCYTHKLVTGRRDGFATIRTPGGLSGFAEPAESPHDTLAAGHAGTGLSYALGMSEALQNDPAEPFVVAVVGDGALTSGTSYEALNNIVHLKPKRLVVVFNDNGWSISENIGWLTHWRNRLILHPRYQKLTEAGQKLLSKLPLGEEAWGIARKIKTSVEGLFLPNLIWEEMGLQYIGPIDGHNLPELEEALRSVREISRDGTPVVLHALTHKGRGYKLAEDNPLKFHQPGSPSPSAGPGARYTYSQVFARTLIAMMETDPKIVAISAAMLEGTGLDRGQEALSRPRLRRRHRGGARRHHGGGHGEGRVEAGRLDLLDVPPALLRPADPRRGAPEPARHRSASTAPASSATTARRTRASSTSRTRAASRT